MPKYFHRLLRAFLDLDDTPASYSGEAGKSAVVNTGEDALEFAAPTPAAHAASHEDTGADEIDVGGLSGELADNQPAKAHALGGAKHSADTLANLNTKVSDATLDDSGDSRTPSAHKTSHQNSGADEVSVTGLSGELADLQPSEIEGDGTAGRVFRVLTLVIADGTDAETLKCTVTSKWNGDAIAETDNVAKGATTGNFTLAASGTGLTIENAGLTGIVVGVPLSVIYYNLSGEVLTAQSYLVAGDIKTILRAAVNGLARDMTTLVDTGSIYLYIIYITDA